MIFIKSNHHLAEALANVINQALKDHKRVVWLVPGGSNIPISAGASQLIEDKLSKKLVIMQTDERFVDINSPDCNWWQLHQNSFDNKHALTFPILQPLALSMDETVKSYQAAVDREFGLADYIIGQFGFGADGHIAGIKPSSLASRSAERVVGYQAEDFARITLTFEAIKQIRAAYAFAFGNSKWPVIKKLAKDGEMSWQEFPASVLWAISTSVVYNDIMNA